MAASPRRPTTAARPAASMPRREAAPVETGCDDDDDDAAAVVVVPEPTLVVGFRVVSAVVIVSAALVPLECDLVDETKAEPEAEEMAGAEVQSDEVDDLVGTMMDDELLVVAVVVHWTRDTVRVVVKVVVAELVQVLEFDSSVHCAIAPPERAVAARATAVKRIFFFLNLIEGLYLLGGAKG